MILKQKKGVSPIIATVFLMGAAIALGAILMSWSTKGMVQTEYAEQKLEIEKGLCEGIKLELFSIDNNKDICFNHETKTIVCRIENSGIAPITKVKIQLLGSKDISVYEVDYPIQIADIKKLWMPYNSDEFGELFAVRFIPLISGTYCLEKSITVQDIKKCA